MVKKSMTNNNNEDEDIDITNPDPDIAELDLAGEEEQSKDIISKLKHRLKQLEEEKRQLGEDTQRTKADFLNARKRLEDDNLRQRERVTIDHIERLLPLCDSFFLAMSDTVAWEKTDPNWRKGIEGINSQLKSLLESYKVEMVLPLDQTFDPTEHEAVGTVETGTDKKPNTVLKVLQPGYKLRKPDHSTELIRPARVIIRA